MHNTWPGGFDRGATRVSLVKTLAAGMDVLQEQIPGKYPSPGQPIDELALAEIARVLGPDGRLVKIVGFFGAPPPPG